MDCLLAVRARSTCLHFSHNITLIADYERWEFWSHLSLTWTIYLIPTGNCPVFPISLYGLLPYTVQCTGRRTSLGSDYALLFFWLLIVYTCCQIEKRLLFFFFCNWKRIIWKYESDSLCNFSVSKTMLGIIYFRISLFLFCTIVIIFDLVFSLLILPAYSCQIIFLKSNSSFIIPLIKK